MEVNNRRRVINYKRIKLEKISKDTVLDNIIELTTEDELELHKATSANDVISHESKALFVTDSDEFIKIWERDGE